MRKFFIIFLLLGSFFILTKSLATNSDIIINEIGAYPTSTHEWIEIWNKGSEPIDLTGWKFWENSANHGLSVSTTDSIVSAGEYAVIAQDANQFLLDYPSFSGSVFDSSWSSLNESGEEIGLKDASGNFVEQFIYISAPNFSLQRRDANLADYTSANWAEHASGNTVGAVNVFESPVPEQTPASPPTSPESQTGGNGAAPQIILESPPQNLTLVKINELVADPESDNEWVELYNTGSANLDLAGAMICDNRNTTSTCKKISGVIGPNSWFVFDLGSRSFLNNGGDSVIFKDSRGVVMDRIDYDDELAPDEGQSLARSIDGTDTDSDDDWIVTDKITAGLANIVEEQNPSNNAASNLSSSTIFVASEQNFPVEVVISELLPNPKGDDSGEFIEIKNNSAFQANLSGWFLKSKEKKYVFPDDTIIFSGSFIVFYKTVTKISIVNTSGKIELRNKNNGLADSVEYEKPPEGKSYGLINDEWEWINPTPGKENEDGNVDEKSIIVAGKTSTTKTYKFVNSIEAARQADKGAWAAVKGVVSVLPGVFGNQYFYLTDGNSGIQIYQSKKDFPELVVGDLLKINGKISLANGIKRINIANAEAIDILATQTIVSSTLLDLDEIEESLAGALVKISGEITEIKSSFMYVDDGSAEAIVYFKKGAKIDKSQWREGENVEVTGVLEQTKSGWQIWPRGQNDVMSLGLSEDLLKKQALQNGNTSSSEKYLTATAGGFVTLVFGFLLRGRGAILKKAGLILVGFIKKNKA